jgi:protein-disulfide isomerase
MKKPVLLSALLGIQLCLCLQTAAATPQAKAANASLEELTSEIKALRSDIREIKDSITLIMQIFEQSAVKNTPVEEVSIQSDNSSQNDYVLGDPQAPLSLWVFLDYQCGFCARFNYAVLPDLKKHYTDKGILKIVFRHYPLHIHSMAAQAASLVACAGEQKKFAPAHDWMFANPAAVAAGNFTLLYQEVSGMDQAAMNACLASADYAPEKQPEGFAPAPVIMRDYDEARKLGINSTPSFFLSQTQAPGSRISGYLIRGAQPLETFKTHIERLQSNGK